MAWSLLCMLMLPFTLKNFRTNCFMMRVVTTVRSRCRSKLCHYVYFRTNTYAIGMKSKYFPSYGLNSMTAVLLQGWLSYQIFHKGWYAKKKNPELANETLGEKFGGNYTRVLRAVLNKSWKLHSTKQQLYGYLPPISQTIQIRQTRHSVHCWRSKDEHINDVLVCTNVGRPAQTYIYQLCADTICGLEDLPGAMDDRDWCWERES